MNSTSHDRQLQQEVKEIYDSLRRQEPDRTTVDLWTEALSLHAVRFETKVLPDPEQEDA